MITIGEIVAMAKEKYVREYFNANKSRISNKVNKHCYILK